MIPYPYRKHDWNCQSLVIPDSMESIHNGMTIKLTLSIDMKKGTCDLFYQGIRLGMAFKDLPLNGNDNVGIVPAFGFCDGSRKQKVAVSKK